MQERIAAILNEAAELHAAMADQAPLIEQVARRLCQTVRTGGTIFVLGNGGSAADAQHMACELVGRFLAERRALACQALTTDTSTLTSVANDYGFGQVFARQVEAFVHEGDVLIGISTSGHSENVIAAVDRAHEIGATTIGLTGRDGGDLAKRCDLAIVVPAGETPRVQEAHGTVIHILCELIEADTCGGEA
jgi:D-sedoheptulose 7-phosphate isomerase